MVKLAIDRASIVFGKTSGDFHSKSGDREIFIILSKIGRSPEKSGDLEALGPASAAELTPSQKFRVTSYIPVIDQYVGSLAHRLSGYEELCSRFGFLGKLESLIPVEIESSADNLVTVCKDDQEQCFGNELVQFVAFSNEFLKDADDNIGKEHFLCMLIIDKRVKCSFPNVEIALRVYSYGHELQW